MVRMQWHVEEGFGAYISPNKWQVSKETGVSHALVEIELAGQTICLEAILSLPPNYLQDGAIKDVGVVLAHGTQAATWKGKTLTAIANKLAAAGYLVMRYNCGGKEQRRLRILEKCVDTAVCCPFARNVTRWVLAGIGSGARVAATVGGKCRGNVVGYALLGYPMMEPVSVFKGPTAPDSTGPLTKLHSPLLFVQPDKDRWSNATILKDVAAIIPSWDVRMVEVEGVDGTFREPGAHTHPSNEVRAKLAESVLEFVAALNTHALGGCASLPRIKSAPCPSVIPVPGLRQPLEQPAYHLVTRKAAQLLPPGTPPAPAGDSTQGSSLAAPGINAAAVSAAAAAAAAKSGVGATGAGAGAGAAAAAPAAGPAATHTLLSLSGAAPAAAAPSSATKAGVALELGPAATMAAAEGAAGEGEQVISLSPATAVRRAAAAGAPAAATSTAAAEAGDAGQQAAKKPRLAGLDLSAEEPPAQMGSGGAAGGAQGAGPAGDASTHPGTEDGGDVVMADA